jgi:hypothetical protein
MNTGNAIYDFNKADVATPVANPRDTTISRAATRRRSPTGDVRGR